MILFVLDEHQYIKLINMYFLNIRISTSFKSSLYHFNSLVFIHKVNVVRYVSFNKNKMKERFSE
jgi:hypothetical protein